MKPATAKSTSQPDWVAAATATATVILAELQAGNFTTLTGVALRAQDAVATRAAAVYLTCRNFAVREMEARAPGAKVQALLIMAKIQAVLQAHVGTLPVWKAAVVQYVALEAEVKKQLLTAFAQVPALQGLTDPVSVQLVTYAIFAIVATLFLLPVIVLLCRCGAGWPEDCGPGVSMQFVVFWSWLAILKGVCYMYVMLV